MSPQMDCRKCSNESTSIRQCLDRIKPTEQKHIHGIFMSQSRYITVYVSTIEKVASPCPRYSALHFGRNAFGGGLCCSISPLVPVIDFTLRACATCYLHAPFANRISILFQDPNLSETKLPRSLHPLLECAAAPLLPCFLYLCLNARLTCNCSTFRSDFLVFRLYLSILFLLLHQRQIPPFPQTCSQSCISAYSLPQFALGDHGSVVTLHYFLFFSEFNFFSHFIIIEAPYSLQLFH